MKLISSSTQELMNSTTYQLTNLRANLMKDITIHSQATIKEAMEALDKTAEKLLLVVDNEKGLLGVLSYLLRFDPE